MARIRTVKPEFFRHEGLYEAEQASGLPLRLAFAGLWTACDREGRFRWRPRQLKLDALPFDDLDFGQVLDALAVAGFVCRYVVDGQEYGFVPSWPRHQVINNREAASSLPEPTADALSTRASRVNDACPTPLVQAQGEGKGREGNMEGKGTNTGSLSARDHSAEVLASFGIDRDEADALNETRGIKGLWPIGAGEVARFLERPSRAGATGRHTAVAVAINAAILTGHGLLSDDIPDVGIERQADQSNKPRQVILPPETVSHAE